MTLKKLYTGLAILGLSTNVFGCVEAEAVSTATTPIPTAQNLHSLPLNVQLLLTEKGREVLGALKTWRHAPVPEDLDTITTADLKDPTKDISFDDVQEKFEPGKLLYAPVTSKAMPSMWVRSVFKSSDETYNQDRKHRLLSIVSLCWYLDALACIQEKTHLISRGSWTLIEAQQNILHYLTDYVRLVTGCANPKNLPFAQTQSNFAYRREPTLGGSSHHVNRSPESQFGIDMRLEADQGVLKLLPYSHTHILFSQIVHPMTVEKEARLTFIKMEPLGMGSAIAALAHGAHFLGSQAPVNETARREKDVPKVITDKGAEIFGSFNKEVFKGATIAGIAAFIHAARPDLRDQRVAKLAEFIQFCKQNGFNNPEVRTGNEVVLDLR